MISLPHPTTKEQHTVNGNYTPVRTFIHQEIINTYFTKNPQIDSESNAILLGGGSGSGKGSVKEMFKEGFQEQQIDFIYIDADEIKELIPEYKIYKKQHPYHAAALVHDESSDISDYILKQCIIEKRNFLYDGTMKNEGKYKNIINELRKQNYHIIAAIADVPVDIAKARAHIRYLKEKRYVSNDIIEESNKKAVETFANIKHLFDEYLIYDNSQDGELNLISEFDEEIGEITYDAEKVAIFYQKAGMKVN
ncbi:zeta toxin family protein [Bacillus cereus]|uniref:zeta toxin family protein n=1 Tax=Bacillus cereus TaxID=1396 RepID=UPI00356F63E3